MNWTKSRSTTRTFKLSWEACTNVVFLNKFTSILSYKDLYKDLYDVTTDN